MVNWREDRRSHNEHGWALEPTQTGLFLVPENIAMHGAKRICLSLITSVMRFIILGYRMMITLHNDSG